MTCNVNSTGKKYSMRIAQLYMAKSKVSMAFAGKFMDHAADCGFNYVNLCIYGRIRTKGFDLFPPEESYSEDEIRALVDYALQKKIEVIPNYELFSHAEHFLQFPGFEHLAELRNGRKGRFSSLKSAFCPSIEETYDIIEAYLAETLPLFPCEYVNAGLDEVFDIGFCDECLARLKTEGQEGIFGSHVRRIHQMIHEKFGKRMMMWDDMFELYPGAFEKLPRDIIMLSWDYSDIVEKPHAHIGGPNRDLFEIHERLGFEYVGVPATSSLRNIETFTSYAAKHKPKGMLLSNWGEMTRYSCFPAMTFAGKLWNSEEPAPECAGTEALRITTGITDPCGVELLKVYLTGGEPLSLPANPSAYSSAILSEFEYRRKHFVSALADAVELSLKRNISRTQYRTLSEIGFKLESEKIYYRLREILSRWSDPKEKSFSVDGLKTLADELHSLNGKQERFFVEEYGFRMPPTLGMSAVETMIREIMSGRIRRPTARLRVKYPFRTGLGILHYSIKYEGDREYRRLCSLSGQSLYRFYVDTTESNEYFNLDAADGIPDKIRIEYSACTGAWVGYVTYETGESDYVPSALLSVNGAVYHPEDLLCDGRCSTFFGDGEGKTIEKILHPEKQELCTVELQMKKVSE